MSPNYKLRIKIELEATTAELTPGIEQGADGFYECVMSSEDGQSIDGCEQVMLSSVYEVVRSVYGEHLSEQSRLYAVEQFGELSNCESHSYRVESELGRVVFTNYREKGTGVSLYPSLVGKEWYRTVGFKEIGYIQGTVEQSYRKTSELLNRVRHQPGATPYRTLRDNTASEGSEILAHLEQKTVAVFAAHGFSCEGEPTEAAVNRSEQKQITHTPEQIAETIAQCAPEPGWVSEMATNPVSYELRPQSVEVSIDDVNVKRQKEQRDGEQETETKRKYAHNTVAHIAHQGNSYIINGRGVLGVLQFVLAFLLHNHLLAYNLIFFVDGQRSLYSSILALFAFLPAHQIILDWYHLDKKCKQHLSSALVGHHVRNPCLETLKPYLWHGCLDKAIEQLRTIKPEHIKNQEALDNLIAYLERNRPYIPCYSVRKRFALRNASNIGEKANDLIVAERQKHQGMSWSKVGSASLAAVAALARNGEALQWFRNQSLNFAFPT